MTKLKLTLNNFEIKFENINDETLKLIDNATSFKFSNYFWSTAYKNGYSDGKIHLLQIKDFQYAVPIGLLEKIINTLKENDIKFTVKKEKENPLEKISYNWNPEIKLRLYQKTAVEAFVSEPYKGIGVIKAAIRSGKTIIAAAAIKELGVRTLFLVPSQLLLTQTVNSLKNSLPGSNIGEIGAGKLIEGDIVVCTIQSLLTRRKDLKNKYDFLILDEVHHFKQGKWSEVVLKLDSRYRLGLSATIFYKDRGENEKGVIYVRGICGEIKYEIGASLLIEQGFLLRPTIEIYKVNCKKLSDYEDWNVDLQNRAIYENEYRNKFICLLTVKKLHLGLKVLIVTNRINQINAIAEIFTKYKVNFETIIGNDKKEDRKKKIKKFKNNEVNVLIGTVLSEGVDISEITCVVNASGGRDKKMTIQKMRNLTPAPGKSQCIYIDFYDNFQKIFERHSRKRVKYYSQEKEFLVKKMWKK
jgi:superfamily II DNA or RNA helicase